MKEKDMKTKRIKIVCCVLWVIVCTGCRMNNKADSITDTKITAEGYIVENPDAIAENMELQDEPVYSGPDERNQDGLAAADMVECDGCKIEMSVEKISYPVGTESIIYRITNQRPEAVNIGENFIEYFNKGTGEWERIRMQGVALADILYIAPAGKTTTFPFYLHPELYPYNIGKYRIFQQFHNEEKRERYSLVAEFELE